MQNKQEQFFEVAYGIAKDLAKEAIWEEQYCNWIGHQTEPVNGHYQAVTTALSAEFYGGLAGIALFLSSLLTKKKDAILEKTLEGAVNSIFYILEGEHPIGNYGLHSGKLGIGYYLWKIGKQQNKPTWSKKGLELMASLEGVALEDHEMDIITGAAGAIPALLEVHQAEQKEVFLALAKKCGDFLIQKAHKTPYSWSWQTIPDNQYGLTGYSHGAAGIAVGLLELGGYTQKEQYLQAAQLGFNYENQWLNKEQGNWPDLREYKGTGLPTYNTIWCHGAPGIALARMKAYLLTGQQEHLYMLQVALHTTYTSIVKELQAGLQGSNFSLCHGLAGNADIIYSAAQNFGVEHYQLLAEEVGRAGYLAYHQTGLAWPSGVNDPSGRLAGKTSSPSLMLGLAGAGYFYLRLAYPRDFPSVLLDGKSL